MKTSLLIDDNIFKLAQKESSKTGKTVSELISFWARMGREYLAAKRPAKKLFKPLNLGGGPKIDLTSRKDWLDELEK